MKTNELTEMAVHAHRENTYSYGESAVLVLEKALWTEKDDWFPQGEGLPSRTLRVVNRAEKGVRPGRGVRGYSRMYKTTGIPVLMLKGLHTHDFLPDAHDQVIDTPHQLLVEALKQIHPMQWVDSGNPIPSERSAEVEVHYVSGKVKKAQVEFTVVRPQTITSKWNDRLEEMRREKLQKAEWARQKAEKKAASVAKAQEIVARVDKLVGDVARYDHNGERYDLHRKHSSSGVSTTYEVSQELLLKLIEMAEKGSA